MYGFKECSSCGSLYTKDHCCSNVNSVDKIVRGPNKKPSSSQQSLPKCLYCGDPVEGLCCRPYALLRKYLNEVYYNNCDENKSLKDLQQTQTHSSESSNGNTNVVNAPQEPFVFNQDPSENSSQSPPHIDHHLLIMAIIVHRKFRLSLIRNRATIKTLMSSHKLFQASNNNIFVPSQCRKIPICYDDDDDEVYTIAITPDLPITNSLIMEDEHLDTIPATESDELIKSSVENLVQIPSESEGIPDKMCNVSFRDNSPPLDISKDKFEGFFDSNDDSTSIDDDSFSIDDIDYVEASPPDSELVSLEEVKDFHTEDGEIEDDILREKLSKINLLIAKIEAINSNPPPSSDFVTKSPSTFLNFFLEETNTFYNSLPESETFFFNLEEISSGSTTTRSDYSLLDYEAFYDHIEEKSSGRTTTHADFSQYDSFIFDLSINLFPLPIGVTFIIRSSPMNSLTSYLHRSMIFSQNTSRQSPDENFHHFLRIWHHSGTQGC
ncbi:hypothetical protein Tco_0932284, partial [Tanacetum coccineum]